MDNSRFNGLPAEIRNEIWTLALSHTKPISIEKISEHTALIATCRQIRDETRKMFWCVNTFRERIWGWPNRFTMKKCRAFLESLDADILALISRIDFIRIPIKMQYKHRMIIVASAELEEWKAVPRPVDWTPAHHDAGSARERKEFWAIINAMINQILQVYRDKGLYIAPAKAVWDEYMHYTYFAGPRRIAPISKKRLERARLRD